MWLFKLLMMIKVYVLWSLNIRYMFSCIALKYRLLNSCQFFWLILVWAMTKPCVQKSCFCFLHRGFFYTYAAFCEYIKHCRYYEDQIVVLDGICLNLLLITWAGKWKWLIPLFLLSSTLDAALVMTLVKNPGESLCSIMGNVVWPESFVPLWEWQIDQRRKWLWVDSTETKFSESV